MLVRLPRSVPVTLSRSDPVTFTTEGVVIVTEAFVVAEVFAVEYVVPLNTEMVLILVEGNMVEVVFKMSVVFNPVSFLTDVSSVGVSVTVVTFAELVVTVEDSLAVGVGMFVTVVLFVELFTVSDVAPETAVEVVKF